jgi:prevent-host-death family protein
MHAKMTISDYLVVMKKRAKKAARPLRVAELKTHLSAYLKRVREGETLVVHDRDTPIARIVPIEDDGVFIRHATKRWEDIRWPAPPKKKTDSLAVLLELRKDRLPL